jgi:hypothetical protein
VPVSREDVTGILAIVGIMLLVLPELDDDDRRRLKVIAGLTCFVMIVVIELVGRTP